MVMTMWSSARLRRHDLDITLDTAWLIGPCRRNDVTGDKSLSFSETIVRCRQISLNDLDDESPPDYRITRSASSKPVPAHFVETSRRPFIWTTLICRCSPRHGARLTIINTEDSRMIEQRNANRVSNGWRQHASCETIPCPKNVTLIIFWITQSKISRFQQFWYTESWGNLLLVSYKFAHFKSVTALPREIQDYYCYQLVTEIW